MKTQPASRTVDSSQSRIHPRLRSVVDTHLSRPWLQPLHAPSLEAFHALVRTGIDPGSGLVLDSGCGSGESTRLLAAIRPDCLVIGVDKSLPRLSRTGADAFPYREGNAVWLQAELSTFWRLALDAGWRLREHYLLYPNPWPKPGQLMRRWHAHPVFPDLLGLGGRLEMRCNWDVYAREFAFAVNRILGARARVTPPPESPVLSPFERKYRKSGHRLYSVVVSSGSSEVK